MRVILLSEVKTLGKIGSIVEVADGYARNFLLPKRLAAEASKGAIERFEQQRRSKARLDAEALAEASDLAQRLEGTTLSVPVRAGGNGKLFGAVTNAQVAQAIHTDLNVEIDRHKIEVPDNIKSLGSYPVEIRLAKNVVAKTTVKVVAAAN
jgi:large subunit ribosomal protein L9